MKIRAQRLLELAVAGVLLAVGATSLPLDWTRPGALEPLASELSPDAQARQMLRVWPVDSRLLALKMLDALGDPDEIMPHYFTWAQRAPFGVITVFSDRASARGPGILLESVPYRVPADRWADLAAFGHGVSFDTVYNELVSISDSEEENLLALNLADEVIQGERSVEDARRFYDLTLRRHYAGRTSWYMTVLRFDPRDRIKGPR